MSRRSIQEVAMFGLLLSVGVALRLTFEHIPNFAPVAGIALFAGFYFRHAVVAIALPIAIMMISDLFIGGYHPALMMTVYCALALPIALRRLVRQSSRFACERRGLSATAWAGISIVGCTLFCSVVFFLSTNLAVWAFTQLYDRSVSGLMLCYWQALPFFRFTAFGDLIFSVSLMGTFHTLTQMDWLRVPQAIRG